jgi:hypothetical protein
VKILEIFTGVDEIKSNTNYKMTIGKFKKITDMLLNIYDVLYRVIYWILMAKYLKTIQNNY